MSAGLRQTEQALVRARNRAVLPMLALALQSHSIEVRATAIRATLRRQDLESHAQLVRLFDKLTPADREVLRETHLHMPHHAALALKRAVLEGDAEQCRNACEWILLCRDREQFPTLLRALEKPGHRYASRVATSVLQFATQLHDELLAWVQGGRIGTDPSFARHQALNALERTLKRNVAHHPTEVVEAFLLLAPSDHPALMNLLRNAKHSCHAQVVETFSSNRAPAAVERLVALLRDTDAPPAVLEAIARRADHEFTEFLLHDLKYPVPLRVLQNMKRLKSIAWLEDKSDHLLEFDGRSQAIAVELAAASGIDRGSLFAILKQIMQHGLGEGRRAACLVLAGIESPEANDLVLAALNDPDSGVQAAAVRQLRPRRIANALQLLVAQLDSPFAEVRDAARSSLAEFNFVRYRSMFDLLDEKAARTTGILVRQVDSSVRDKLIEDLTSASLTTKQRAIEMTLAMGAADDVRDQLIALTHHENAAVRKEAVTALEFASGADVTLALEFAVRDPITSVADTARQIVARQKTAAASVADKARSKGDPQ
jgi:HEAT repeat protein